MHFVKNVFLESTRMTVKNFKHLWFYPAALIVGFWLTIIVVSLTMWGAGFGLVIALDRGVNLPSNYPEWQSIIGLGVLGAVIIIFLLNAKLTNGLLVTIYNDQKNGVPLSFSEALRKSRSRTWSGAFVAFWLVILSALGTLVFIIPGILLANYAIIAYHIYVTSDLRPTFRQSWKSAGQVVAPIRWRIVFILLIAALISGAVVYFLPNWLQIGLETVGLANFAGLVSKILRFLVVLFLMPWLQIVVMKSYTTRQLNSSPQP